MDYQARIRAAALQIKATLLPTIDSLFHIDKSSRQILPSQITYSTRRFAVALCAVAVASCGGGGDDSGEDTNGAPPPASGPTSKLTISISGEGEVRTPQQTLSCSDTCVFDVETGSSVTLEARPGAESDFNWWRGDCDGGPDTPTCEVMVVSNTSVVAGFKLRGSDKAEPRAVITGDTTGLPGGLLDLSGVESSGGSDSLTYAWAIVSQPALGRGVLETPTARATTFHGEVPGVYVVSLVVDDGISVSSAATVAIALSTAAPTDAVGVVTLSPNYFLPGDTLTVMVHDNDLNTDTASRQSVSVAVINQATDETENLTLTETGNNTGSFRATLPTASGSVGVSSDGRLTVLLEQAVQARYSDAAPAGTRSDTSIVGEQLAGPSGQWPWALQPCETTPSVVWGDYQAAPRAPDSNRNGIPDVAESAHAAGLFFWFDPGPPGVSSPAVGDVNGNARGDTLDAAFDAIGSLGGGTLGIIGLGEGMPYEMLASSGATETEMSGYVYASIRGDIEICALNDVAVINNATTGQVRWQVVNNHDFVVKNVKFDGIEVKFQRNSEGQLWWYNNVWMGNTSGKCPQYSDNPTAAQDTMLRPKQGAAGVTGGGSWDDPTTFTTIRFENTHFFNCNTNRLSHGFYIETEGCFLYMNNSILEGVNNLEVWRILCRGVVIENSLLTNTLDWDTGTVFGASVIDLRSNSAWVFRNNHVRVLADSGATRYAMAIRSRRDNTGSSLPNQWPGTDAASDPFAGNDSWGVAQGDLATRVAARPLDDSWLHNGYVWNREFWREVTSSPWRGDQRTIRFSGAGGFQLGDTVTGAVSGASGKVWKIDGDNLHVMLDSATEFQMGESVASLRGAGTVSSKGAVTARALAENEHLFPKYLSGNVFEGKCLSASCPGLIPLHSFGSLPGVGVGSGNRYFVVPLDDDPDLYPADGYDTEATPGDGWVERVIMFSANNSFVGDWTTTSGRARVINTAVGTPMTFHDGERSLEVWEAAAVGPRPTADTPVGALTPATAPPTFVVDIGGTAEAKYSLPVWWPQGDISETCEQLRRRYGDDPIDPTDFHWWDEPGAETGHPAIGHDGFPIHDGINACPR